MPLPVPPAKVSVANVQAPPTALITPPALPAHVVVDAVAAPHAAGTLRVWAQERALKLRPRNASPPVGRGGGEASEIPR